LKDSTVDERIAFYNSKADKVEAEISSEHSGHIITLLELSK
jgi:hypothetical protein